MTTTTKPIEGLDDVLETLRRLPPELASKNGGPSAKALRKGAQVIHAEVVSRAPVKSGFLRDNIVVLRDPKPHYVKANEHFWVGVRGGARARYANTKRNRRLNRVGDTYTKPSNAFYFRFYEFGTERQKARPFIRPSFALKAEEAQHVIAQEMRAGVDKIVKKLARPIARKRRTKVTP